MSQQHTVAGRVLYAPRAGSVSSPAKGVLVATDRHVCITNERGEYELPVQEGDRFVKVTTPRGYAAQGPWFHALKPDASQANADFTLATDASRDQESFTFIQITDLHLHSNGWVFADHLRRDLDAIMERWADRAAFVVATGDLSDRAKPEELQACRDVFREQPIPVFALPGNHDYYDQPTPGTEYARTFGPGNYSFDWGPVHFVSYDSVIDGPESSNRLWLERELSLLPPAKPIVMLIHYQMDDTFFSLWDRYPLVASISGHWHSSRIYHDGRRTHYNGPPLSFGGIDFSPRGYRVFHWSNGELTAETFALTRSERRVFEGVAVSAGGAEAAVPSGAEGAADEGRVQLQPLWRQELPGKVHMASPIIDGDRVYMSTLFEDAPGKGGVTCLDAASGQIVWTQEVGDSVKNSVAVAQEKVYGVTVTGTVFALDAETGDVAWRTEPHDPSSRWVFSSPVVHNGRVFAGSSGHFRSLDATTGSVLWERNIQGDDWISSYCSPVVVDSLVLVGFQWKGIGVVALDTETGEIVWNQGGENHASVGTPLAIDDEYVYAIYHGGAFRKLTCDTGKIVWETDGLAFWNTAGPVVGEGVVYVASGDGRMVAFDRESGQIVWQRQLTKHSERIVDVLAYSREQAPLLATPLLLGNALWVATSTGQLVALDAEEGQVVLQHEVGVPLLSGPVYSDGRLFVADLSGCVHAFAVDEVMTS